MEIEVPLQPLHVEVGPLVLLGDDRLVWAQARRGRADHVDDSAFRWFIEGQHVGDGHVLRLARDGGEKVATLVIEWSGERVEREVDVSYPRTSAST